MAHDSAAPEAHAAPGAPTAPAVVVFVCMQPLYVWNLFHWGGGGGIERAALAFSGAITSQAPPH